MVALEVFDVVYVLKPPNKQTKHIRHVKGFKALKTIYITYAIVLLMKMHHPKNVYLFLLNKKTNTYNYSFTIQLNFH